MEQAAAGRKSRLAQNHPGFLVVSLALLILLQPLTTQGVLADYVFSGLFTLVVVSAVLSVLHRPKLVVGLILVGAPLVALEWMEAAKSASLTSETAKIVLLVILMGLLVVVQFRLILEERRVTVGTILRAISVYLIIGIVWGMAYGLVLQFDPEGIRGLEASSSWGEIVYFSFTVLTTLGFGDIVAASPVVRSLVVAEAILGPLYLAILIARLVSMYEREPKADL